MFFSEAKLAAQLNHPNVVTVFDFGEDAGTYYLVMEYIDGPNLRALFKRANELKTPIPFGHVAKIISFACEGLAFAHDFIDPDTGEAMNLVHRDISPDNVLLARNGGVKVVDFGIAKASNQSHHTRTGTIKGKFAYMPPEQLRGMNLDRRADIFALGIVLHELVAGVKPFDVASDATIMQAILYEKMKPAAEARPDTPAALQAIIDRALEKDRDARYPDCRAMQADLERYILSTGEPVGQFQLSQLVKTLAGTPSQSNLAAIAPKTPSHPSLAVAGNMATPGPPRKTTVSQANAPAVEPTDFRIDLSQSNAKAAAPHLSNPGVPAPVPSASAPGPSAPPPAPRDATAVTGPPKPILEVMPEMPDLGAVQIRSSPALSIPQEAPPPKRGAWIAVLAIGVLFLGIGGTLVGVKLMSQRGPALVSDATPPQPAPVQPAPVQPSPPPEPKPTVVAEAPKPPEPAPVPAPAPVAEAKKEEPEPAAPPTAPNKKGGKREKEQHAAKASAVSKKETRPEPRPEPKPVVVAEAPKPPEPAPEPAKKVEIVKTAEMGTIAFRIRPYATVLVDGKYLGDTPVSPITVPVGNVTVTLINKDLGKELKVPFEVKAGQNTFKYNLEE
jgi:serine/threonine-protein kinase